MQERTGQDRQEETETKKDMNDDNVFIMNVSFSELEVPWLIKQNTFNTYVAC